MNYESVQTEILRRLGDRGESALQALNALLDEYAGAHDIYAQLVGSLLSISVDNERARPILNDLMDHHKALTERLGQELDLRVSAMDYAVRHPELLEQPVVVSREIFTLSQRLAAVDELTGLFNRRFLDTYLSKELNRAHRYQEPFSLVFVDVDNFKHINDTYGHPVGDRVLAGLGTRVLQLLRREDFAARYGGEEFLIVLPHTDTEGARRFSDRLQTQLEQSEFPDGVRVTYSGGIATFPDHGVTAAELLRKADVALYQAKTNGKAHVRVAAPEKRSVPRHVADLRAICYLEDQPLGEVLLQDISEIGVSVAAETLLSPGQNVRFWIEDPQGPDAHGIEVIAQVVWSRKVDHARYRVGGRWHDVDESQLNTLIERVSGE